MTPVATTSLPGAVPGAGQAPRGAASPTGAAQAVFSLMLGDAPAAADTTLPPGGSLAASMALSDLADEAEDPLAVDVQLAEGGWPPAGLAGLLGLPDAPVTVTAGGGAAPNTPGVPAATTPAAGALALAAETLQADAAPVDLDLPLPAAALPETDATLDGEAPAPLAFALPATAATAPLREPAPLLATPLPAPEVGAYDFEARFGAQLEWMAEQKIGHARIRVTPHDLGPVEVRLHLDGDRLRADFVSAHAETRQALEQGLPRLRDLLGESGFQLAHAGVGSGHAGDPASHDGEPSRRGGQAAIAATDEASAPVATTVRALRGLLDAYA